MDSKVFQKVSYGLYVIGSTKEGAFNGQIANTVFQISSEPATVAISINKNNLTCEYIKASGVFSVSILPKTTALDFIGRFGFKSGRNIDKYQGFSFKQGITGAPVLLEQSVGFLEAQVIESIDVITHMLFIGKVVDSEVFNEEEPMTYSHYHQVKKGKTPQTAPTYIKEETGKKEFKTVEQSNGGQKYKCLVCGYIYDPGAGDPDSGIKPGTALKDLPDNWVCPICGAAKDQFEPISE